MSTWSAARRWIRDLIAGQPVEAPRYAGVADLAEGVHAIVEVESLAADAIYSCRPLSVPRAVNAFGRPIHIAVVGGGRGALAAACGMAMSGRRTALIATARELTGAQDLLRSACARRIPLVVHIELEEHAAYHALADLGCAAMLARNLQHATDLTLAARRIAERGLGVVVVAMDVGTAATVRSHKALEAGLVTSFLSDPGSSIECPTAAQAVLFGDERRLVPRFFDPDRPVSLGVLRDGAQIEIANAGRRVFFDAHLVDLVEETYEVLGRLTGRPLGPTSQHGLADADHVVVAEGSAIETVQAVVDHLRTKSKRKVGVLGIHQLRPFPHSEVVQALARAERVTVLEHADDSTSHGGVLWREIGTAASQAPVDLLVARPGPLGPTAAEVAAVFENMRSEDPKARVYLGVREPTTESRFPKRDALMVRVQRACPELELSTLALAARRDLRPAGAVTVLLGLPTGDVGPNTLTRLAKVVRNACPDAHVCGRRLLDDGDIWAARVTAAGEDFADPADAVPVDIALLGGSGLASVSLAEVVARGRVVVASGSDAVELWASLPRAQRASIRDRELRLFVTDTARDALPALLPALLAGEVPAALQSIDWEGLDNVDDESDLPVPAIVKALGGPSTTYESFSRFWSEVAQPSQQSALSPVPDPYQALGALPPYSASCYDAVAPTGSIPELDPDKCVGCGRCWTECPHSAIGATAIGTEALLGAATEFARDPADERDPIADKIKRAHKQLASRIDGQLAKVGAVALDETLVEEAFEWLVGKLEVSAEERTAYDDAFEVTLEGLDSLPVAVTEPFFHAPNAEKKGSGQHLVIATDPRACVGCGVCARACAEEAILMGPRTIEGLQDEAVFWAAWQTLPDTPGATIAAAARRPEVGPLASVMLSRSCLLPLAGADAAEPGSAQRLALRQVLAVVEHDQQQRVLAHVGALGTLVERLRERIRTMLGEALPTADLGALRHALTGVPDHPSNLGALVARLEELGEKSTVPKPKVKALVAVAERLADLQQRMTEGADGMARARVGLVVAGESVARWAATYPRNAFGAPVSVDLGGDGPDLARGLVEGLLSTRVEEATTARHAEALLAAASNVRVEPPPPPSWRDLSADELAPTPQLLCVVGSEVLDGEAFAGLSRLLSGDLPVKVIVLDDRSSLFGRVDATQIALAHRRAFVLSSSISHADHLYAGMRAALDYAGPALIHLYTPSARKQGIASDTVVEHARLAVVSRVHPLLRYDPSGEGSFGTRLDLGGNPDVDETWAKAESGEVLTPASWALAQAAFASSFSIPAEGDRQESVETWALRPGAERDGLSPSVSAPDGTTRAVGPAIAAAVLERLDTWATLQELAGVVTPFADRVRAQVQAELGQAHAVEVAAIEARHQQAMVDSEQGRQVAEAARLRDRLLTLAGYSANGGKAG